MNGRRVVAALIPVLLLVAVACEPTLRQASGVVIDVDTPSLGRVDGFQLLDSDGETHTFDTSEMAFRAEFPAPHLSEHRVLGDRIVVTYKEQDGRLIVTQLDDE